MWGIIEQIRHDSFPPGGRSSRNRREIGAIIREKSQTRARVHIPIENL
jgi:hypothetical protein